MESSLALRCFTSTLWQSVNSWSVQRIAGRRQLQREPRLSSNIGALLRMPSGIPAWDQAVAAEISAGVWFAGCEMPFADGRLLMILSLSSTGRFATRTFRLPRNLLLAPRAHASQPLVTNIIG